MSGNCLQKCRGTVFKSVGELSPKVSGNCLQICRGTVLSGICLDSHTIAKQYQYMSVKLLMHTYTCRPFVGIFFPTLYKRKIMMRLNIAKKVREKSRECHNHKPQPFPDPKRKRKPTNLNKNKPNRNVRKALRLALSSPSLI